MAKKSFGGTVFVRTEEMTDTLLEINERHGVTPNEMTRRLLSAACAFYRQHGWFSFPVVIEPEEFQRGRFQLVAEDAPGAASDILTAVAKATPRRKEVEYPPGKNKSRAPRG